MSDAELPDEVVDDAAPVVDGAEPPVAEDAGEPAEATLPVPEMLRPGMIAEGRIAKLVDFGAFVDVETSTAGVQTGLVHVSEVAPGFVDNIYAELIEGDEVRVKVLSIAEDGKIGLSIKQADPAWGDMQELDRPVRSRIDKDFDRRLRKFMHGSQSVQGEVRRQKRNKRGV